MIEKGKNITYDKYKIKEILISIKNSNDDFEVYIRHGAGFRVAGTYIYEKKRILLYLYHLKSNNDLIRTAIHEYAHHFVPYQVHHNTAFWECYFDLLEKAKKKGLDLCNIENSEKLLKITSIIKKYNLINNRKIFKKDLKWIFYVIIELCKEIDIDFQYYTVKYLEMDWYKKSNPNLVYTNFLRNCTIQINKVIIIDELLQTFFDKYCL